MPSFKSFRGKDGLQLSLELTGFAEAMAGLNAFPINVGQEFKTALRAWADDVMARSQALVPVNTGRLKSTGVVTGPEAMEGGWQIHLGYGDRRSAYYAAIVHERLGVRHPRGSAKYLEIPINENLKTLDAALANALERALLKLAA